jgi:alpha-tubulin suppressor-like RCC1 family protein
MAYGTKCGESITDIFISDQDLVDSLTIGYLNSTGLWYLSNTLCICGLLNREWASNGGDCVEQVFRGSTGCHAAFLRSYDTATNRYRLVMSGKNDHGQLGNYSTEWSSSMVSPIDCADFSHAATGSSHTVGVKVDGSLWTWGRNNHFQLGITNTISRSSPVQVSASGWKKVAAGEFSTFAITANNSLYAWGKSDHGQTGIPSVTATTVSTPTLVGSNFKCVSAGSDYAIALKTDNTLWAWGFNTDGRLGLGDTISRSSPVQICVGKYWKKITAGYMQAAAIDMDNNLYVWGCNGCANLGLGTTIAQRVSCPVQIGCSVAWRDITINCHIGAGISTEGKLYLWGDNTCSLIPSPESGLYCVPTLSKLPDYYTTTINNCSGATGCSFCTRESVTATDKTLYILSQSSYI